MNELITRILNDIKKGSVIQFVMTLFMIVGVTGYVVDRGLSPIVTTAILYWEGGFTEAELERSRLYGLCDNMRSWPMSTFSRVDTKITDKCKVLKRRHKLRTSSDWREYQKRAKELKLSKDRVPDVPKAPDTPVTHSTAVKGRTPKENGIREAQPP